MNVVVGREQEVKLCLNFALRCGTEWCGFLCAWLVMHLGTEVAARSHQNTIASCSNASSSSTETIRQCDGKPTPRSLCDRTTGRLAFEPQVFETPILATASTAVNKSIYSRHLAYTFQTLHCKLDLISPTWFNAMPQATEKNLITGSTAPQYFAHLAPPHRR